MSRKAKRRKNDDLIWEGYRRAKRNPHPRQLAVGSRVVYEDTRGHVHRWTFDVDALTRTSAVIKGWPDGVKHRGPRKKLIVLRSAIVSIDDVREGSFKAAFDVPEDRPGVTFEAIFIGVEPKRRQRRKK